jgi:hypothetical protein
MKEFSQTLQVGAGDELRELTKTLQTMQDALVEAQGGIGRLRPKSGFTTSDRGSSSGSGQALQFRRQSTAGGS